MLKLALTRTPDPLRSMRWGSDPNRPMLCIIWLRGRVWLFGHDGQWGSRYILRRPCRRCRPVIKTSVDGI